MAKIHVIRGFLCYTGNGYKDNILSVIDEDGAQAFFLSDRMGSIFGWGGVSLVTLRYYTSLVPLDKNALDYEWMKEVMGAGDARYGTHFSDPTGYLWTDEDFNVGGHNLIQELSSYVYKFIHLEIEVHEK